MYCMKLFFSGYVYMLSTLNDIFNKTNWCFIFSSEKDWTSTWPKTARCVYVCIYSYKYKCQVSKTCFHLGRLLGFPAFHCPSTGMLIIFHTSSCSACLSAVISRRTAWPESKPFYQKPLCRGDVTACTDSRLLRPPL